MREAFKYNPDTWDGRVMYSLSKALGFSLDTPWKDLPETARNAILYGIEPKKVALQIAAGREGQARRSGRARKSASAASRGGSSATTAATASAAKRTRGWRRGSTR